jgi:hypothetical protein
VALKNRCKAASQWVGSSVATVQQHDVAAGSLAADMCTLLLASDVDGSTQQASCQ